MAKLTLTNPDSLANETNFLGIIESNNDAIEAALENTLSRDGTTPNTMGANLDMNSNRIVNLPAASNNTEPVRKAEFDTAVGTLSSGLQSFVDAAEASADEAANSATAAAASALAASLSATNADASADAAAVSEANAESWANLSATIHVGSSPPAEGNLWYDTLSGSTYVSYDDGDTTQWVAMVVDYPQHTHVIAEITDFDPADYYTAAEIDFDFYDSGEVDTLLAGKANSSHSHAISDVTSLQTTLDGKAASSHTHAASAITSGTLDEARLPNTAAQFTLSTSGSLTDYPVGSVLLVNTGTTAYNRNAIVPVYLGSGASIFENTGSTQLTGTWRSRGQLVDGSARHTLVQRTA